MRVLIWHNALEMIAKWQTAFGTGGHEVRRSYSADGAITRLRSEPFDLLIFDFSVGREGGLSVAFMAEFHQPGIVSILVSDQQPDMHSDLFSRFSSLRCVLGAQTPPKDIVAIAEAFVFGEDKGGWDGKEGRGGAKSAPQICMQCSSSMICSAFATYHGQRESGSEVEPEIGPEVGSTDVANLSP